MGRVHIAVDADPRDEFATAIRECGLQLDGPVQMDGQLHRVPAVGDKGRERSGTYIGHLDGKPAGYIQNFETGQRLELEGQRPGGGARRPGPCPHGGRGGAEASRQGAGARAAV